MFGQTRETEIVLGPIIQAGEWTGYVDLRDDGTLESRISPLCSFYRSSSGTWAFLIDVNVFISMCVIQCEWVYMYSDT